jgi:hypothetical protein
MGYRNSSGLPAAQQSNSVFDYRMAAQLEPMGQIGILSCAIVGTDVADNSNSVAASRSSVFFIVKLLVEVGVAP